MKITFILPDANLSGGVRVVAIYAEKLKQRGHQVVVAYAVPRDVSPKQKVKALLKGRGWPRPPTVGPSHLDGRDIEQIIVKPWEPIADRHLPDADVVVATWWETAEWVARLSPSKGAKAYFLQHYEVYDTQPLERVKATWALPLHKIVIAGWLDTIAREQHGDNQASMVPNAVDLEQFNAPPRGKQAVPTVGLMFSHTRVKGTDVALAGVARARQLLPALKLVAFGDQPPNEKLPLPPGTDYTLRPAQDRIRDIYASCDFWLMGSRSEGFGLPLLEAMACRAPIISTPTGAAPELVQAGGGFLVRHEDPEDLGQTIVRGCNLPAADWQALSARAHGIASSYTWDQATDKFQAALELATRRARNGDLRTGQAAAGSSQAG